LDDVFNLASSFLKSKGISSPDKSEVGKAVAAFSKGVPYSKAISLGTLITAAWAYVAVPDTAVNDKLGRAKIDIVNDLVMKSAEIAEFSARMT
jgi:hypothetical protein